MVKRIVAGLIIGAVLGLALPQFSAIGILGSVFVGALKAVAPLLVFFLVISSLCHSGKSHGGVIRTVIVLYMFSTFLAAVIAVIASMMFPITLTLAEGASDLAAPEGIVEVFQFSAPEYGKPIRFSPLQAPTISVSWFGLYSSALARCQRKHQEPVW